MSPIALKAVGDIRYYAYTELDELGFLTHGFSTRLGGVSPLPVEALNLSYIDGDADENVERNRLKFLRALNWKPPSLCVLKQVHSDQIYIIDEPQNKEPSLPKGDGLITTTPGLLLAIQVADCIPLLLVDVARKVIANLHAGWRGTLKRIAQKGVSMMRRRFGCLPGDLIAALGPAIGPCCYEVGEEVIEEYKSEFDYADSLFRDFAPQGKAKLDLIGANVMQLLDCGLRPSRVLVSGLCTCCHSNVFFSNRRERGRTGRMMGVIGINPARG